MRRCSCGADLDEISLEEHIKIHEEIGDISSR